MVEEPGRGDVPLQGLFDVRQFAGNGEYRAGDGDRPGGSSGRAFVPMVVGAPSLRRYTLFGHLFAGAADGQVYRIDRHPAMMRHPVTPMREADLRLHLREQTTMRVGLLDALQDEEHYRAAAAEFDAVLIDVLDEGSLERAGALLWGLSDSRLSWVRPAWSTRCWRTGVKEAGVGEHAGGRASGGALGELFARHGAADRIGGRPWLFPGAGEPGGCGGR